MHRALDLQFGFSWAGLLAEAAMSANEKGLGIHDQIDEKIDAIEALLLAP